LVDIRFGIVELLESDAGITARVSTRIFPAKMKQGETRDSIVYTRITEFESYTMERSSGLVQVRYQIDAWSLSTDSAASLGLLIKEALSGFRGRVDYDPPSPTNFVNVQMIEVVNSRDDYDDTTKMYRMSRDYYIWFEERNA
jgi:hypothetical protein